MDFDKISINNSYIFVKDSKARSDISNLNNKLNVYKLISEKKNKNIILITDSYGTNVGNVTPFTELLPTMIGKTLNTDYFYNAKGGASWKGLNGRPSFETLLRELDNTIPNPENIDLILVLGGVNDAVGTIRDIYDGATSFVNYAKVKYPNAKVLTSMIGWNRDVNTKTNIINVSYAGYNNLGAFDIGVIDNGLILMHDYRTYLADGTHPSASGQNNIAYGIASYLNSGNICVNGRPTVETNVSLNSNLFKGGTLKFSETRTNDLISVTWNSADLSFNSGVTLGYDAVFTLGTKESVYWERNANIFDGSIVVLAKLVYNDGSYKSRPVLLTIVNDKGTLKAYPMMDHEYNNIPSPTYLSILGGSATINPLSC